MAEEKERKEDLNPHAEELEAKVRRMMDPSVPDETKEPTKSVKQSIKIIQDNESDDKIPSAPELPNQDSDEAIPVAVIKNNRKIIKPLDESVEDAPAEEKKISVKAHDASPDQLAKEIDDSVAKLAPEEASQLNQADDGLGDKETDKAVDEIVREEGDTILEVDDTMRETGAPVKPTKPKHRSIFKNRLLRWVIILVVLACLVGAAVWPTSRYMALNTAGVRASSSLTVIDGSTGQPLKDAQISIGNTNVKTDSNGLAKLTKLRLGKTELTISKLAFGSITKTVTLGWGSNPLGKFQLDPTGAQYQFQVTDFLSGQPITDALAESSNSSAKADSKGLIKLTIDPTDAKTLDVKLSASGYRDQKTTIDLADHKPHNVKLVLARKDAYVTKQSGKFDIYTNYVDGTDPQLILAGTGHEQADMVLLPHPSDNVVAYVSTRANQSDGKGGLLSGLLMIDLTSKQTSSVTIDKRIQLLGWSGDYLIYEKTVSTLQSSDAKYNQIFSYNYQTGVNKQLATSNYFNDVILVNDYVYYAPSNAVIGDGAANFYRIKPDGSDQKTLFNQETVNIFRLAYDRLTLSIKQDWYEYVLDQARPNKLSAPPSAQYTRIYSNNPDGSLSAWVDQRDGKGVLLIYNTKSKADTPLYQRSGLSAVVGWLNNSTLVYRVANDQETADYAVSLAGGDPVKITDVSNSFGIRQYRY